MALYSPRPIKATRQRRTRAQVGDVKSAIYEALKVDHPMTVRQVFYRLVSQGMIAKTEGEYKATVVRLLSEMRRAGEIPYGWLADNTRWQRKPRTYGNLEEMLDLTARTYRRALWSEQATYVEIWLEKEALAGVLMDVTDPWDVPLMVTRGYPSLSYLYEAAETIRAQGKPAYLYYFGDYDPSGVDIPRWTEAELRRLAPDADIHFQRVAVTSWQIGGWHLPTRPTKTKDSRAKSFGDESVEVDAIPPATLRDMVSHHIEQHINYRRLEAIKEIESQQRAVLENVLAWWRQGQDE